MMNFLYGLAAGGLIVGVATIAAARNPGVQSRLGLFPPAQAALAPAAVPGDAGCKGQGKGQGKGAAPPTAAKDANADALFSRSRFWYVAPGR